MCLCRCSTWGICCECSTTKDLFLGLTSLWTLKVSDWFRGGAVCVCVCVYVRTGRLLTSACLLHDSLFDGNIVMLDYLLGNMLLHRLLYKCYTG